MDVHRWIEAGRARWLQQGYPDYAPVVPIVFDAVTVMAAIGAVVQRIPGGDTLPATGLVLVALYPFLSGLFVRKAHWLVATLIVCAALGTLMVAYPVGIDIAVLMLVILVGHLGAIDTMRNSGIATAITAALLVGLGVTGRFDGTALWLLALVAVWDVGWIMQAQQRKIDQQEQEKLDREIKGAYEERQRIAREVHDVVAHSLSVTLLHLTAARRDLEDGGDPAEVVDALREAETVGRQAMNDIRQTVGLLSDESGNRSAAPELSDVPALVQQFRAAGLDVDYETAGDATGLSASARTGLFRIVQESLANIAKHEPRARATVTLDLSADPARLAVRNSLTHPVAPPDDGRGLRGMAERARSLGGTFTAGPYDDGWQVLVELANPHAHSCPLPKLRELRRPAPETA